MLEKSSAWHQPKRKIMEKSAQVDAKSACNGAIMCLTHFSGAVVRVEAYCTL